MEASRLRDSAAPTAATTESQVDKVDGIDVSLESEKHVKSVPSLKRHVSENYIGMLKVQRNPTVRLIQAMMQVVSPQMLWTKLRLVQRLAYPMPLLRRSAENSHGHS